MAKTKLKGKSTANPRSRISKRASSPSINTDKSLKEASRPEEGSISALHVVRSKSGVVKAKRNSTAAKSRNQRLRQERVRARAEAVVDQLQIKLTSSAGREKKRRERRKDWSEVNGMSNRGLQEERKASIFSGLHMGEGGDGQDDDSWDDDNIDQQTRGAKYEVTEAGQPVQADVAVTSGIIDHAVIQDEAYAHEDAAIT